MMDQQSATMHADPDAVMLWLARLRRHVWPSLAIIAATLALAAVLTRILPKTFSAAVTLAYDPQMPLEKGGGGQAMTDAERDAAIDGEIARAASWPVALNVAHGVDLAANPKLAEEAAQAAAKADRPISRDEALAKALINHVKAARVGQTPTFTIKVSNRNAIQAARIANGFAVAYLQASVQQKAALASAGAAQIDQRLADLRAAANAAEAQLAGFRQAGKLVGTGDALTLEQEVGVLRGQLADARGAAALAGTRSAMANGGTAVGGGSGGSLDTTSVSALTEQRAAAAADLAALLGRYGEKHPDVIAARSRLAELDGQLAMAMGSNRSSAVVEAHAAGARAAALAGSLGQAEGRMANQMGDDARLADLENSATAARLAYQDGLKISADQTAQRALIQPDAQVIVAATPPMRASFPKPGVDLLAGLALGAVLAAGLAAVRELWLRLAETPEDIVRWLDLDYFTSLPLVPQGDPAELVLRDPRSPFATSIRSLASAALFVAQEGADGGRVIGVASALAGEGKTTACIALARLLAAAGRKVALIDGDPGGGRQIGALSGGAAGDGSRSGAPMLDRSGAALFAAPDLSGGWAATIAALRPLYEVIIIDCAPVLAGDGWGLWGGLDALVLLARWRKTPLRTVAKAMRQIVGAGGSVSGVAIAMFRGK